MSPGPGVGGSGVYNRAEYLEEKRAALEAWATYVEVLVRSLDSRSTTGTKQSGLVLRSPWLGGMKNRAHEVTKADGFRLHSRVPEEVQNSKFHRFHPTFKGSASRRSYCAIKVWRMAKVESLLRSPQ